MDAYFLKRKKVIIYLLAFLTILKIIGIMTSFFSLQKKGAVIYTATFFFLILSPVINIIFIYLIDKFDKLYVYISLLLITLPSLNIIFIMLYLGKLLDIFSFITIILLIGLLISQIIYLLKHNKNKSFF